MTLREWGETLVRAALSAAGPIAIQTRSAADLVRHAFEAAGPPPVDAKAVEATAAYRKLWTLLDTLSAENRQMTDGEAEWFHTMQPASLWPTPPSLAHKLAAALKVPPSYVQEAANAIEAANAQMSAPDQPGIVGDLMRLVVEEDRRGTPDDRLSPREARAIVHALCNYDPKEDLIGQFTKLGAWQVLGRPDETGLALSNSRVADARLVALCAKLEALAALPDDKPVPVSNDRDDARQAMQAIMTSAGNLRRTLDSKNPGMADIAKESAAVIERNVPRLDAALRRIENKR